MRRIAAKYIYDGKSPEPLKNGFVEVADDGLVVNVGISEDPSREAEFYDGAIVPGFVNAHCHVELSHLHGKFRKGTGMAGFIDQINEMRDTSSPEDKKAAIGHWMDEMWRRGVSAMADISNCDDSFECKSRSPMYTRTFLEVFGTEPEDCGRVMDDVMKLQSVADSFGLDAAPAPHACYTMSPELLAAASAAGLRSGYLSYHCEETDEEEDMLMTGSGAMYDNRIRAGMSVPPIVGKSSLLYFLDRLAEAGTPPLEEHILLVHEVCITGEGIEAVKKMLKHPYIALCPCSNIFIHNALPSVELIRRSGITVTVGTDSLSSNDDLDMIREVFCLQENFSGIPLGELLGWATRGGADFLGKGDVLGRIAPGYRPGIVYVSCLDDCGRLTSGSVSRRII